MTGVSEHFERDALLERRSVTLADIAQQLLGDDAGAALIRAALISWERRYGKEAALERAYAALVGVQQRSASGDTRQN